MAKNNNSKISVSTLDKLIKQIDAGPSTVTLCVGEESAVIEVRRDVSLQEFCDMVDEATNTYFQYDEAGQEHYVAGVGDFACDYVLLKHLTNLKTAADVNSKEQQNNRLYTLCVHTDLIWLVEESLPKKLILDYHEAVYEQVEFRKQQMLSNERQTLQAAIEQIDKVIAAISKSVEMFQNVDPASMMESIQKIAAMDETAIAKAVVDARDKDFVAQRKAQLEVVE